MRDVDLRDRFGSHFERDINTLRHVARGTFCVGILQMDKRASGSCSGYVGGEMRCEVPACGGVWRWGKFRCCGGETERWNWMSGRGHLCRPPFGRLLDYGYEGGGA